ncbi:hypothetical protein A6046_03300 [[Haemophilus] ducreyi]|uniref:DUF2681 domain-containing protein n=2 Tax=Haemophilus ducreyi TaxID=730 RepID=Q7VPG3_HAEDU|nr:DUF2681 domain-containing protein [[Haemophilus] ducreyi]AAP95118.1 hypothetical protein HD_0115 [[Haemophilus] ducreyi 35000HP]AKO30293.1 hypothetical protein RY60_00450 [[Haemophilus] ducreyi]AKO31726.1 hypothetical protein RZ57_00455 [[Haemophilus] ducreyi]AKO33179.1 hypothetical protein RZ58_00455 [[Haemophilus] ducreyi]AKO34628.1 hypothetical protein RZ59_00450 [[Haemophilus] ducreyi]
MINLSMLGGFAIAVLILVGYVYWRVQKARRRERALADALEKMTQQNEQLKTEKAVAEKQVKNYKVKQRNEENANSLNRDSIIDGLRENNDLRPD